jgi:ABC-2 type transport system ATP-binding protein
MAFFRVNKFGPRGNSIWWSYIALVYRSEEELVHSSFMHAFAVEHLVKTYSPFLGVKQQALRGINLHTDKGTAFGLIGPNGAGKTTFIKLLLGIIAPTSGNVEVLGGDPQDRKIRAKIGYLPERMHLPAALRGSDFLRSIGTFKNLNHTQNEIHSLLARVGLQSGDQRIGTYSKGMRQRLGLAAAMLGTPELLVLDEPTDGIDPQGRVEIRSILLEEKNRGATILLNSHLLAETEKVCDQIAILEKGQVRLHGTLDELLASGDKWSVEFKNVTNPNELISLGFTVEGSSFSFLGDAEKLNLAIDLARKNGSQLISLQREKTDLEALLAANLTERSER